MLSNQYRIPMLKIRRSRDRLIFNMGISIPGKDGLYIEMGPRCLYNMRVRGCCDTSYHTETHVNTLRPRQNGRCFADDLFKCISMNENVWILIRISLQFVPYGPINNIPALVQIMTWRRPGDKPFSEPMMVRLATHICVTRPPWVKLKSHLTPTNSYHRWPLVSKFCTEH